MTDQSFQGWLCPSSLQSGSPAHTAGCQVEAREHLHSQPVRHDWPTLPFCCRSFFVGDCNLRSSAWSAAKRPSLRFCSSATPISPIHAFTAEHYVGVTQHTMLGDLHAGESPLTFCSCHWSRHLACCTIRCCCSPRLEGAGQQRANAPFAQGSCCLLHECQLLLQSLA